jgi:hypothetical protein
VYWNETSQSFQGIVIEKKDKEVSGHDHEDIKEDISYDVANDDDVDGKKCIERNVDVTRLQLASVNTNVKSDIMLANMPVTPIRLVQKTNSVGVIEFLSKVTLLIINICNC